MPVCTYWMTVSVNRFKFGQVPGKHKEEIFMFVNLFNTRNDEQHGTCRMLISETYRHLDNHVKSPVKRFSGLHTGYTLKRGI